MELLYRQRFLRAVSVGFRAREFSFRKDRDGSVDGVEYTRQELLELSAVPVPANPHALAKALEGGLETPRLRPLFTFDLPASCIAPEDAQRVLSELRRLRGLNNKKRPIAAGKGGERCG